VQLTKKEEKSLLNVYKKSTKIIPWTREEGINFVNNIKDLFLQNGYEIDIVGSLRDRDIGNDIDIQLRKTKTDTTIDFLYDWIHTNKYPFDDSYGYIISVYIPESDGVRVIDFFLDTTTS
jgi:hypothetical protein